MSITKEQILKARSAKNPEELFDIVKEYRKNITLDKAKILYEFIHGNKSLDDERIGKIIGGNSNLSAVDPPFFQIGRIYHAYDPNDQKHFDVQIIDIREYDNDYLYTYYRFDNDVIDNGYLEWDPSTIHIEL